MEGDITTILIVEDSSVASYAFHEMIGKQSDMRICDTVECVEDLRGYVDKHVPNLLLIDVYLPERRGDSVEYTQMNQRGLREGLKLKSARPSIGILFTSILIPEETVRTINTSMHCGGLGFVHKSAHPENVIFALREVARGRKHVDYETTRQLLEPSPTVTSRLRDIFCPREKEILIGIADGLTAAQIGHELGIAEKSVSTYVRNIRDKLMGHNIKIGQSSEYSLVHLAHFAVQIGLTAPLEISGFDDPNGQ